MTREPTRSQILVWGVLMAALLALALYDWSAYQVGTYGDDGTYIANADSLVQHAPYGMLLKPNETEPTQFPFVFPLLLAPVRAWFPESLDLLRLIPLSATLLALSVLFWGWHSIGKGLSYWWGLGTVALMAFSPLTILHARTVMSEAVFLLLCLLMIVWVERVVERQPRGWGIVFGILVVGVAYTRSIGWVFVAVWVGYLIWKLRGAVRAPLGVAVLSMAALVALVLSTTSVRAVDLLPQEYMQLYAATVKAPPPVNATLSNDSGTENSATDADGTTEMTSQETQPAQQNYLLHIAQSLVFHLDIADLLPYQMQIFIEDWTNRTGLYWVRLLPGLLAVGVAGLGTVVWVRRTGLNAFQLVVPPYLLALVLWSWSGPRLFYPIQPQIFLTLLLGVYTAACFITQRILPRNAKPIWAAGAAAALLAILLGASFWLDLRLPATMLLGNDLRVRANYLLQHIPADAVVVDTRAVGDRLYTPRTFVDVPHLTASTAELIPYLTREHITYVVTEDGLNPTAQNSHLRTATSRRFIIAWLPLVDTHSAALVFRNHEDDIAIYHLDTRGLAAR